jgi:hypothetical protein
MNKRRDRGNVVAWLPVGVDASTDAGRAKALGMGAAECLAAAKRLHQDYPLARTGEYILAAHALELALKSFLAKEGLSNNKLKNEFGHDLVRLFAKAIKRGLVVTAHNAAVNIETVNDAHDRGAALRFDFTKPRELPNPEILFPIVEQILAASKGA